MLKVDFVKTLPDFSLNIKFAAGQGITALFGPSGSGKSLTLQCLAGLLTPDEGQISLHELVFFDKSSGINLPPQKRSVGYVFQNYGLFPHLTVYQNIAYGLKKLPKDLQQVKVSHLMQKMRLQGLESKMPGKLSGGQQQRVALARALAPEPKLLLLDEPFSALDSAVRSKLRGELLDILGENPVPVILVTHGLDEAYSLSQCMAVIEAGKVIQRAKKQEILNKPANRTVARLTRAKNIFSGEVKELSNGMARIQTLDFSVFVPAQGLAEGESIAIAIRPHQLRIFTPEDNGQPKYNTLKCIITKTINHVDSHTLYLRLEDNPSGDYHFLAKVSVQLFNDLGLEDTQKVLCCLPPHDLTVIK